jgi:hypothetical protein
MKTDARSLAEKPPAYDNYSLLLGVFAVLFVMGGIVDHRGQANFARRQWTHCYDRH